MQSKPLVQDLDPHFNAPTISHGMAKTKISNKKDTYNSMIANGYLLAALTSTCMTIIYMDGVRKKKLIPEYYRNGNVAYFRKSKTESNL